MRERVEKLAQGKFDYNAPNIEVSTLNIDFSVEIDGIYEGEISLKSLNVVAIKGFVYSSSYRLECDREEFFKDEITIRYKFNAKGLNEGEVFKCSLNIVTNGGEYNIPVSVAIYKKAIMTSLGRVKNLFHFANLAMENFEEAYELFVSDGFEDLLEGNDKKYLNLYRVLIGGKVDKWTLEDFLVGINKKNRINYTIDSYEKTFVLEDNIRENIEIRKNTWGFLELEVETDCDFISLEKDKILAEDFIGNVYNLEYYVNYEKLHNGNNYGKIILHNIYQRMEICIFAKRKEYFLENAQDLRFAKQNLYALTKLYLDYRCKKINTNPWAKTSMDLLNVICEVYPNNWAYKLMKAQLFLIEKKTYEAKNIIEEYEKNRSDNSEEVWDAYAMYLTTFYNREKKYIDKTAEKIEKLYDSNSNNWKYLWMHLFINEELNVNYEKRFKILSRQIIRGCNSPVIYAEVYRIMSEDNYFLSQLDECKLQVLWWAAKNELIDRENALFIANMAQKEKNYNELLYKLLSRLYDKYGEKEFLAAICQMLIKGNRVENKYFYWYEKGVESDIKITQLYEYYMYSIDLENRINLPKKILMYFIYDNSLDYKRKAYVYENVILQKDELPELFQSYRRHIEEFIIEQIKQKHNDKRLAYLYETMNFIGKLDEGLAEDIVSIIFKNRVVINGEKVRNVIVVDKYLSRESRYPVSNQESYIDIFTDDRAIALEDAQGRRYSSLIEYDLEKIMDTGYYVKKSYDLYKDSVELNLKMSLGTLAYGEIDEEYLEIVCKLLAAEKISEEYKSQLRQILVKYCFENYNEEELRTFIEHFDIELLDSVWKKKVIEYLIINGLYKQAYSNIKMYGYEGIDNKKLLKFISCYIMDQGYDYDNIVLSIAKYTFKNRKYNEYSLNYLIRNYKGSVKLMKNLWKAACSYGLDTYDLVERIIVQMLFTNTFIGETGQMFEQYQKQGPRYNISTAYFTYNAYEYIMYDRIIEEDIKKCLEREYSNEKEMNVLCEIALIKIYSEKDDLEQSEKDTVKHLLWKYTKQGIMFRFFGDFSEEILGDIGLEDKTIVEYKTRPGKKVFIHYLREDKDGVVQEFKVEEIKQHMEGVYSKLFTLFYGDSLQYYICEDDEFTGSVTKSDIITKTDTSFNGSDSRYNMLNTMCVCIALDDEATLLELMKNYAKISESREQLFMIM